MTLIQVNERAIKARGNLNQLVALVTDPDKLPRQIIGYKIAMDYSLLYILSDHEEAAAGSYYYENQIDWETKPELVRQPWKGKDDDV